MPTRLSRDKIPQDEAEETAATRETSTSSDDFLPNKGTNKNPLQYGRAMRGGDIDKYKELVLTVPDTTVTSIHHIENAPEAWDSSIDHHSSKSTFNVIDPTEFGHLSYEDPSWTPADLQNTQISSKNNSRIFDNISNKDINKGYTLNERLTSTSYDWNTSYGWNRDIEKRTKSMSSPEDEPKDIHKMENERFIVPTEVSQKSWSVDNFQNAQSLSTLGSRFLDDYSNNDVSKGNIMNMTSISSSTTHANIENFQSTPKNDSLLENRSEDKGYKEKDNDLSLIHEECDEEGKQNASDVEKPSLIKSYIRPHLKSESDSDNLFPSSPLNKSTPYSASPSTSVNLTEQNESRERRGINVFVLTNLAGLFSHSFHNMNYKTLYSISILGFIFLF